MSFVDKKKILVKVLSKKPIQIWNRKKKILEAESVYGGALLEFFYSSKERSTFFDKNFLTHTISKLIGWWQNSSWSKNQIEKFIHQFQINMQEYEEISYSCFNDFFIRKFRPESRIFEQKPTHMPAFCEGRYLAYTSEKNQILPIKGIQIPADLLLAKQLWAKTFTDGPAFIARLCPTDYHRFHFPDNGKKLDHYSVHGSLHSVNPMALAQQPEILLRNERQISILETDHFGKLAFITIGAMCVGRIIQSHHQEFFRRGEEKGYFLFGASCVVILGERGKWLPNADLLEQSTKGIETFIKLGEEIASV